MGIVRTYRAFLLPYVAKLRRLPRLSTHTQTEAGLTVEVELENMHFGKPTEPVTIRCETWFDARAQACVLLQAEPFEINVPDPDQEPAAEPRAPAKHTYASPNDGCHNCGTECSSRSSGVTYPCHDWTQGSGKAPTAPGKALLPKMINADKAQSVPKPKQRKRDHGKR